MLGDIECTRPLDEVAAPLLDRGVAVYWIHGNHDYDTGPEMWANLVEPERNPLTSAGALHMRVIEIGGIRMAGCGWEGRFCPMSGRPTRRPECIGANNSPPILRSTDPTLDASQAASHAFPGRHRNLAGRCGCGLPVQPADHLVTDEAPSSHPEGVSVLDDLARAMGARLIVHGHHHVTSHAKARDGLSVLGSG